MKRDLKINYGILDDIIDQFHTYQEALETMKDSLGTINHLVEENRGESIEAWRETFKDSTEHIKAYETQIEELTILFEGYVEDTTAYISPLARQALMRVDRNDIWVNLEQIDFGINNNVPKALNRTHKTPSSLRFWEDPTKEEEEASRINQSKIENIRSDIQTTKESLEQKMEQLWDLHKEKVVNFENMDDDYNTKAGDLKNKYTNFFEGVWDVVEGVAETAWDLIRGLFVGLYEIAEGLLTLVSDAGILMISATIPDIIEPDFIKDAANDRIEKYSDTIKQIIDDPILVVENIAQSVSDTVEEEGIAYVAGNIGASFVPLVGWSKYAKLPKLGKGDKGTKAPVSNIAKKDGKPVESAELLSGAKRVGSEFFAGVTDGMRIFKERLGHGGLATEMAGAPGYRNVLDKGFLREKYDHVMFSVRNVDGKGTGKYQVGAYKDIKGVEGLDAHHAGQKAVMKKLVDNYDPNTAPAINVPKVGHTIKGPNGIVSRSTKGIDNPRQLLARDIMELRRVYDDIPNSSLRELIELNKKMYPEMRK